MNDFVRESINQGSSGGGSSSGKGSSGNTLSGKPAGDTSGQSGQGHLYNPNYTHADEGTPMPPAPKSERDEQDPNLEAPNLTGANKKKKKRKGKRDLRRGGFLSSLKIDRGSALGGTNKQNPYSIGGM